MNSIKIRFAGEYENTLDSKNRVNIPAKFRKALDPINDKTFVITRGFDACIVLYPLYQWNKVEKDYLEDSKHTGKVINLTPYGAFLELEDGIGGLVHVSDFSWTKKIGGKLQYLLVCGKLLNIKN